MAIDWNSKTPWNQYSTISTITLPTGTTYYFKDAEAREQIEELASYSDFLGVTGTALTDGDDTNPIMIGGEEVTAESGNIVLYNSKEFIWNGTAWAEFGDLSALAEQLGDLAYANTASGEVSISGDIEANFEGIEGTVEVAGQGAFNEYCDIDGIEDTINASGTVAEQNIVISGGDGTATYTPAGSITNKVFNGNSTTIAINYTPEGTVTASFKGTEGTVTVSGVPQGAVTIAEIVADLTGNYTPQGTVKGVVTNVETTSVTINNVTDRGTLPSLTGDYTSLLKVNVSNEDLTFTAVSNWFSAGALPTTASVSFNAVSSVTKSDVELSGTTVLISAGFTGSSTTFSGSFTPAGNIVNGSLVGTSTVLSSTFTPTGSISAEFSGIGTRLTGTFASTSVTVSGNYTPQGAVRVSAVVDVSASGTFTPYGDITGTFSGASTVTVTPD